MKVNVLSVKKVTNKEGNIMFQIFANLNDGGVGNFWSTKEFKAGDSVELAIGINKECKFVVRPVLVG